jgi:hypothetical protein
MIARDLGLAAAGLPATGARFAPAPVPSADTSSERRPPSSPTSSYERPPQRHVAVRASAVVYHGVSLPEGGAYGGS